MRAFCWVKTDPQKRTKNSVLNVMAHTHEYSHCAFKRRTRTEPFIYFTYFPVSVLISMDWPTHAKRFSHNLWLFHFASSLICLFIYFLLLFSIFTYTFFVCSPSLSFSFSFTVWRRAHITLFTHHRIYHKSFDADKFGASETKLLWKRFDNLKPNTQYVFYLVAISGKNDETSLPSEKIVVWTDPAMPPVVDVSARDAPQ